MGRVTDYTGQHTVYTFLRGILAVCNSGVVLECELERALISVKSTSVLEIALRLVEILEEIHLPCKRQSQYQSEALVVGGVGEAHTCSACAGHIG